MGGGLFGIGGLEFLIIFGVAIFVVGPKRLAEGVRTGRKYYTELKRQRDELTALVTEAIDAEELKKDFEETKKAAWDDSATEAVAGVKEDLTLDQGDLDIVGPIRHGRSSSTPKPIARGNGKISGKEIPTIDLGSSKTESDGSPGPAPGTESRGSE